MNSLSCIKRQHWKRLAKKSEHIFFRYCSYSSSKDSVMIFMIIEFEHYFFLDLWLILVILFLLTPRCKGVQFEAAWGKHKDDPNLTNLVSSLSGRDTTTVNITAHEWQSQCSAIVTTGFKAGRNSLPKMRGRGYVAGLLNSISFNLSNTLF